jgi:hypothetical protein
MAETGNVGQIRTHQDLKRAVQRLRDRGITDPDALITELIRGRSSDELRMMLTDVWNSLSTTGRQRALQLMEREPER